MRTSPGASTPFDTEYFSRCYHGATLRPGSINWWSARFYAGLCRRELRHIGGRRLLEVGCGYGHILRRLQDAFECWGIDITTPEVLAGCQANAPSAKILPGDILGEIPLELPVCDMIIARYVLEHLAAPERALANCARLLRPGGTLLFAVPDPEGLLRERKGDEWHALKDPTHVSLLPAADWFQMLEATGFEVIQAGADGFWDPPYVRGVPKMLQLAAGMGPAAVQMLAERVWMPLHWGENLIVHAKRI